MKKLLTFLFALSCAGSVLAAKYDCNIDGIYYQLNKSDMTATVTNEKGGYAKHAAKSYSGSMVVPVSITWKQQTYSVTTIGDYAFAYCYGLTSITIPNSVTTIGEWAFAYCRGLTSVTIPNSVTTIGISAFIGCDGLTSVTIPNSVTTIGNGAFKNCRGLTSVTIPNSVTTIGESAFSWCSGLTSITIPNSVTTIGDFAFSYCESLPSITIPNSVTTMGLGTFKKCNKLTSITIPNCVNSIDAYTFEECHKLTSITIPSSVKEIGQGAFIECTALKEVVILSSNIEIGSKYSVVGVFDGCKIDNLYCLKSVDLSRAGGKITNIHRLNNEKLSFFDSFSKYAQLYVESHINEWQKKGKYEKTEDWQKRVNETTRKQKINDYLQIAKNEYLTEYKKNQTYIYTLGDYDPDNEAFLIHEDKLGDLIVPVAISDAQYVEKNWNSRVVTPHYDFAGEEIVISSIDFRFSNNKTYTYKADNNLTYAQADIQYNFDPIEIDLGSNAIASQPKGQQTIEQKKLTIGKSAVDTDIPTTNKSCPNTFAVIISNENYTQLKEVPCAINDGKVFAQYCEKTIGLPKDNIKLYTNATYGKMIEAIRTMKNIAKAYNGDVNIIFYYSGHGAPTDDTKEAYLLPVDAFGVAPEVCYSLNKLYKELADMKAKSVTMFLDACFSGATKDGDMLASVRGVAIKAKANAPMGNMVVFSAASDEQTALPYLDMGHGLFTYYVLKKLQETKGDVTYQELGDYVKQEVYRRSSVVGKVQTPTVSAGSAAEGWQGWKLK